MLKRNFKMVCLFFIFCLCVVFSASRAKAAENAGDAEHQTGNVNEGVINGWNGRQYFVDGSFVTGRRQINGNFYLFDENGQIKTGWQKTDGKYSYYEPQGEVGKIGGAKTGLVTISKKKFYFDKNGMLETGMKTVRKKTYYFAPKGKAGKIGAAQSGWVTYKKYCYFFNKKNFALEKNKIVDGYKVDKKGRSKTRYKILQIVNKYTNKKMTKKQKIRALFNYVVNNSWRYRRTYEHTARSWKWYKGWQDDFAYQLMTNKCGNCYRYAAVYGYLVKEATGYNVRVYRGYTLGRRGKLCPHGWTAVKVKGKWYSFDPDMYKFWGRRSKHYFKSLSWANRVLYRRPKYVKLY